MGIDLLYCIYSKDKAHTMNIYKVRDNLKNTIAGKEAFLASVQEKAKKNLGNIDTYVTVATIGFLEINIDELKKILADVETCCQQAIADSWRGVDRQGGI